MKTLFAAAIAALLLSLNPDSRTAQPVTQPPAELPPVAEKIMRMPALSPDGKTLAFVYDGDIWSVASNGGDARRLTITADNDGDPMFSPDGKWLAFRSRRYGSENVFMMPAEGGPATRLTFSDAAEQPCCWLPDSSAIIFSAALRDGGRDLWVQLLDGSEPWPITGGGFRNNEISATISPDGKHIAYVDRGNDPMRNRNYNGASNGDLWLCDFDGVQTRNHRALTRNRSHDAWPVFADNEMVVYVTAANGARTSERATRLAACNLKGEEIKGWGGESKLDPRELALGGGKIAFATGNYGGWRLHCADFGKRPPVKVNMPDVRIRSDVRTADLKSSRLSSASEFDLSPDGKKLAFIAGGDVFIMPTEEGGVPRQETDTPWREKDIAWAGNDEILFTTVAGGMPAVTHWNVVKRERVEKPLAPGFSGTTSSRARHVPGVGVLCIRGEKAVSSLYQGEPAQAVDIPGYFYGADLGWGDAFDVSPDGKWVLYTQPNAIYDRQLWVANVQSGEQRQLTRQFGNCTSAGFTRDGKRVVFANDEHEDNYDIWVIDLQKPPVEFKEDKLEKLLKEPPKKEAAKPEEGEKKDAKEGEEEPKPAPSRTPAAKKPPETKIDFEDLDKRTRRVTSLEGNESSPVCIDDGKTFFFVASVQGQSNIWKLVNDPDKGPDLKQVTTSRSRKSDLRMSADEKTLWYSDGGAITSMNIASSRTATCPFSVEQRRDRRALRDAAFDEATWVMGGYFYDDNHHGLDWAKTAARYRSALDATSTGDEFGAVANELLGELNSSHQGFGAQDERSDGFSESVGCLGIRFHPVALSRGEYQTVEFIKRGPLDVPEAPKAGQFLVGINGKAVGPGSNLARELNGTIGRKTVLHFNDNTQLAGSKEVAVKPISRGAENGLHYQRWVEWQRQLVHKKSGGRLGYVHIQGMNMPSVREFIHHLGDDMLDCEGVVIDVRFNGGGNTAVDILEILIKKQWLIRQNRGLPPVSENAYRSITLEKPTILMINQDSFSNAEILAEGFRKLKIGSIVGIETAGGVIGTGSYTLIDGSSMRLPGTGAYTVDMENLENAGRKPDIAVDTNIEELDQGIDQQTDQAVKTLLEQIGKKK